MDKIKLIVGLGNVGEQYANTRHNIGQEFVDCVADKFKFNFTSEKKFFAQYATTNIFQEKVFFAKPLTFMNNSGKAVVALANFFKISPQKILIIHDELDIPCGSIKMKFAGGNGGHNGLNDIQRSLGTNKFWRLRIGISHPGDKNKVINYVLNKADTSSAILINEAVQKGILALDKIIAGKFDESIRFLHSKDN